MAEVDLLDFDPSALAPGRKKQGIVYGAPVELASEEAQHCATHSAPTISPLKRIGSRHHMLARLLAEGNKPGVCAAITGYDNARISILQNDPAFKELVEFYRATADAAFRDMHEHLAGMSADALNELRQRLEDDPEDFSVNQLMELLKVGADRTGFGPQSTQNTNIKSDIAVRLEAGRKRAAEARTIEGTVNNANG